VISRASFSDPTGLLVKDSLVRCGSVPDDRVNEERSVAKVEMSVEGVYVVTVVVLPAVVVVAAGVELSLLAVVVVVRDPSKAMSLLSTAGMSLIDVNSMLVVGYG